MDKEIRDVIWGKADLGTTSTHTHTQSNNGFETKIGRKIKTQKRGGNSAKQHSTLFFSCLVQKRELFTPASGGDAYKRIDGKTNNI